MLTEIAVRTAKPKDKPYTLTDGRGLHLHVDPRGGRWWRLRYWYEGRQKMISLGTYPDIGLALARERRDEARRLVATGIDPSAQRRAAKAALADTVEALADEYFRVRCAEQDPTTVARDKKRLEKFIFPSIGKRPLRSVTAPELLAALRRIEDKGRFETAHRVRGLISRITRLAIGSGRAERNVADDLIGTLGSRRKKHYATITEPTRIADLLKAIYGYQGQPVVTAALRLAPLVFVRPGELRGARWAEFDLDGQEPSWRIPGERMKMGTEHIVPLAPQAVTILKDLQALTGNGELCFPGLRSRARPISDNTINAALRRLGFDKDTMTGHGFRSLASTRLNEMDFPGDVVELQLSHAERNKVRASYNFAKRLPERRKMMIAWADYLDDLRTGSNVVPLRQPA